MTKTHSQFEQSKRKSEYPCIYTTILGLGFQDRKSNNYISCLSKESISPDPNLRPIGLGWLFYRKCKYPWALRKLRWNIAEVKMCLMIQHSSWSDEVLRVVFLLNPSLLSNTNHRSGQMTYTKLGSKHSSISPLRQYSIGIGLPNSWGLLWLMLDV